MPYLIHKRGKSPRDQVLCARDKESDARRLINSFESIDLEADLYEPETYYIEEAIE